MIMKARDFIVPKFQIFHESPQQYLPDKSGQNLKRRKIESLIIQIFSEKLEAEWQPKISPRNLYLFNVSFWITHVSPCEHNYLSFLFSMDRESSHLNEYQEKFAESYQDVEDYRKKLLILGNSETKRSVCVCVCVCA